MKKLFYLVPIFITALSICQTAHGQLKMAVLPEKVDTIVIVPYDSLNNIEPVKNFKKYTDSYDHMIGQTVSIVDTTEKSGFGYRYDTNKHVKWSKIYGKPLIVKRIDGAEWYFQDAEDTTKTTRIVFNDKYAKYYLNRDFVSYGYYEKVKQMYLNQDLVYVNQDDEFDAYYSRTNRFRDYETKDNLRKLIPANTIWKCTDVLVLPGKVELTDFVSRVILNLENEKYGTYYVYADEIIEDRNSEHRYFMSLEEFNKYTAYNNQLKAAAKAKAEAAAKQAAIERENYRKSIINRYGEQVGNAILSGNVLIGMTSTQCREAWGSPKTINRTTSRYGVREQWVYAGSRYLYFENGILTTIQD